MTDRLVLALAQIDPTVGDVAGNCDLARRFRKQAADEGADLVVLGELAVSGYPPEDLVLKPAFLDQVTEAVQALAKETGIPYQNLINSYLRDCVVNHKKPSMKWAS